MKKIIFTALGILVILGGSYNVLPNIFNIYF